MPDTRQQPATPLGLVPSLPRPVVCVRCRTTEQPPHNQKRHGNERQARHEEERLPVANVRGIAGTWPGKVPTRGALLSLADLDETGHDKRKDDPARRPDLNAPPEAPVSRASRSFAAIAAASARSFPSSTRLASASSHRREHSPTWVQPPNGCWARCSGLITAAFPHWRQRGSGGSPISTSTSSTQYTPDGSRKPTRCGRLSSNLFGPTQKQ